MPGNAASTVETCVFGSAPKSVAAPENSLARAVTWAWTSRPMTTSHEPVRPSIRSDIRPAPLLPMSFQSPRSTLLEGAVHCVRSQIEVARPGNGTEMDLYLAKQPFIPQRSKHAGSLRIEKLRHLNYSDRAIV